MRERARAPAKVNLILRVHDRDPTGYHDLDTLFCALELADELTLDVAEGDDIRLEVEGPQPGPAHENLAVRAARAFLDAAGTRRDVGIRLRKRIPAGGGLGGGSSDAAAVLRALDRLMPDAVDGGALRQAARDLGSDVPFFLAGMPHAWGTGRGERLREGPALPSIPVLLLFPPFPVGTAAAYGWIDTDREAGMESRAAEPDTHAVASWEDVATLAGNDFEGPVFRRHPRLRDLRDRLRGAGAQVALLSGSGSTVFGVFPDEDRARAAAADVRARSPDVRWELTRTAAR